MEIALSYDSLGSRLRSIGGVRIEDPGFSQRSTLTIDDDGNRMVNRGEMSRDGGPWEDDLSLTFTRVGS